MTMDSNEESKKVVGKTVEEAIDVIKCLAWHERPKEEDIEQAIKVLESRAASCIGCKFARNFNAPVCMMCSRFYDDYYCKR